MCIPAGEGGFDMPLFSFEKIAPPPPLASLGQADTAHRGIIVQLFDQIAEARMQREVRAFRRTKRAPEETDVAPERGRDH
jgi:hypothetical protein